MEEVAISKITRKGIEHADVLDRLYRSEYIGMVRLAYTLVGSNAEAEDVVQEALLRAWKSLDALRDEAAAKQGADVAPAEATTAPEGAPKRRRARKPKVDEPDAP